MFDFNPSNTLTKKAIEFKELMSESQMDLLSKSKKQLTKLIDDGKPWNTIFSALFQQITFKRIIKMAQQELRRRRK